MKKFRKLIPALCLLLISAILMSASTYAWFSMNTAVTAKGMSVTAKTEGGLAIAPYTAATTAPVDTAFASSATATYQASASVFPTSTATGSVWYKATATDANNYVATSANHSTVDTTAIDNYRLISKYQVKSLDPNTNTTGNEATLYVTGVTVSGGTTTSPNKELNLSLRVAVVIDSKIFFFAPMYTTTPGATLKYWNGSAETAWTIDTKAEKTLTTNINANKLNVPVSTALNTTAKDLEVYVYYEGEDPNCMSVNAVNVDTLTVDLTLSTVALT